MPFAAFDLLPPSKSNIAANFGCFHTLAVNNGATRIFFSLFLLTELTSEAISDAFPHALLFPLAKMIVDRRMMREIMRDHFPLAPGFVQVQQGIDDTTRTDCSG